MPFETLLRSHNELVSILKTIPDVLFKIDREGKLLEVHAARESLLLIPKYSLVGRNIKNILPDESAATIFAAMARAEQNGTDYGTDILLNLGQGEHWFELSVAFNSGGDKTPPYFIILSRNISERKNYEIELEQTRNALLIKQRELEAEWARCCSCRAAADKTDFVDKTS